VFRHWFDARWPKPRDHHGEFDRHAGNYRVINTFATVGVASAIVRQADENRHALTFTNSSANNIWLSKGAVAVIGSGVFLAPNGSVTAKIDAYGYFYRGPWAAIATGAASNMGIVDE